MRMLVTGAAGFIGSHLCRRLVADGHEVIGLDDLSEGSEENLADLPEVQLVRGDLRHLDTVRRAAGGVEAIFHQGALRSVPRSMQAPGPTVEVNVVGTANVLIAAHEAAARVVSASSSSVYGDQTTFPLHEDLELRPRSPYAASKAAGEQLCAAWWRAYGVPAISLRYFNVYGPGQDPASEYAAVVPRFISACLESRSPVIFGDGEQARDFTYIDDVVEANVLAASAGEAAFGRAFNIGGGRKPTSVNRLLAIVAELTGTDPQPVFEPSRPGDVGLTEADVSPARKLLGYEPAVGVKDGLRRTVEWLRSSPA